MPIRVLPADVANRIAAGEVIDRPASVVKELVENALDAGARDVHIDIAQGGRARIAVIDDGAGMTRDDALLAIKRHATSKIETADDLWSITSFGFRGEALPSIASVSKMTIVTRPESQDVGTQLTMEGATVAKAQHAGCAPGTAIMVDELFFNTPARRKFLKTVKTELNHVVDVVTRIGLARPDVGFHLTHDGGRLLDSAGDLSLAERVKDFLGKSTAAHMVAMEHHRGPLTITGMVGVPGLTRSSRNALYTYVNGRHIRDKVITHAIIAAYGNKIPSGRYPVAVVFLDIPSDQVDVNVHPAKHEVRFHASQPLHQAVERAVKEALAHEQDARYIVTAPSVSSQEGGRTPSFPARAQAPDNPFPPDSRDSRVWNALAKFDETHSPPAFPAAGVSVQKDRGRRHGRCAAARPRRRIVDGMERLTFAPGFFSALRVLGQLDSTYIICESDHGMVVVDQHTAHERVGFEELRRTVAADAVPRQTLLFPEHVELGRAEAVLVEDHLKDFERLGLPVEPFGGATFVVRAVPAMLRDASPRDLLLDVVDEFAEGGSGVALDRRLDDVLATMSCHSVVRAHRVMRPEEITHLLGLLDKTEHPQVCPHGRPTALAFSFDQLETLFGRR